MMRYGTLFNSAFAHTENENMCSCYVEKISLTFRINFVILKAEIYNLCITNARKRGEENEENKICYCNAACRLPYVYFHDCSKRG